MWLAHEVPLHSRGCEHTYTIQHGEKEKHEAQDKLQQLKSGNSVKIWTFLGDGIKKKSLSTSTGNMQIAFELLLQFQEAFKERISEIAMSG